MLFFVQEAEENLGEIFHDPLVLQRVGTWAEQQEVCDGRVHQPHRQLPPSQKRE